MDRERLKDELRRHALEMADEIGEKMPGSVRKFGEVERALKEVTEELHATLLQSWCDTARDDSSALRCPHCGRKMRQKQQRGKQLICRAGDAVVKRKRWCEECGASFFPLDEEVTVGGLAISPEAGQAVAHLRRHHGIAVSEKLLERLTQTVGEFWLQRDDREAGRSWREKVVPFQESREAPDRRCVFADGTMVHLDGGWHEVRVGTVCNTTGERVRKSSIALLADVERFGADL